MHTPQQLKFMIPFSLPKLHPNLVKSLNLHILVFERISCRSTAIKDLEFPSAMRNDLPKPRLGELEKKNLLIWVEKGMSDLSIEIMEELSGSSCFVKSSREKHFDHWHEFSLGAQRPPSSILRS